MAEMADEHGVPPQRSFRAVYLALMMLVSLAALDSTVISVAVPTILDDLGGATLYSWVGAAYLLTAACFAPLYGKTADVLGRQFAAFFALGTFLFGSLFCAAATDMPLLILARAIQGIGGGGLMQMVRIITSDITTPSERGKYLGGISATWGLSTTLGGFVGGAIITIVSWRAIFLINIPIGGLAGFMLYSGLNVPKKQGKTLKEHLKEFDLLGLLLIGGGSAAFLLGLNEGSTGIFPFILGVAALVYGAYHEVTTMKSPIIPPRLFKRGNAALVTAINGLHNLTAMIAAFYLPLYFQILGSSPLKAGILTIPFAVGSTLTSTAVGFVLAKHPHHRFLTICSTALMTIGAVCMTGLTRQTPLFLQEVYTAIAALGMGPLWTLTLLMIQSCVSKDELATATTGFGLVRSLSGALGVTIGSALYSSQLEPRLVRIPGFYPELRILPVKSFTQIRPQVFQNAVIEAHVLSIRSLWLFMIPTSIMALGLSLLLPRNLEQYEEQDLQLLKQGQLRHTDEEDGLLSHDPHNDDER